MPLQEKPKTNSLQFLLDRLFYLPGQRVQGQVQVNLQHDTSFRSLNVSLQGVESTRVVVRHGKGSSTYKSSRDMLNQGIQLLLKATVQEGTTLFPFTFELPPDALPSYTGKTANVTWKLSARADIPLGRDLSKELFLPVLVTAPEQHVRTSVENPEPRPKLRLSLSSTVYQPGEVVEGKLTVIEPGNFRAARMLMLINETASGKGNGLAQAPEAGPSRYKSAICSDSLQRNYPEER